MSHCRGDGLVGEQVQSRAKALQKLRLGDTVFRLADQAVGALRSCCCSAA